MIVQGLPNLSGLTFPRSRRTYNEHSGKGSGLKQKPCPQNMGNPEKPPVYLLLLFLFLLLLLLCQQSWLSSAFIALFF